MTNELQAHGQNADATLYAVLVNAIGQYASGTELVTPDEGDWSAYAIELPEPSRIAGSFYGDMPAVEPGLYTYLVYECVTLDPGPPAMPASRGLLPFNPQPTDPCRGSGSIIWDGSAEIVQLSLITDMQPFLDALAAGVSIVEESKMGFKLAADGLDEIPITPPTGAIETFTQLFVNLWSRFATRTAISTLQAQLLPREVHVSDIGVRIVVRILDGTEPMDLRSVTKKELHFKPPNGAKKTKTAVFSIDGSDGLIEYVTVSGDLSEVGNWQLQAYIELGTAKLHSNLVTLTIHANL